MWRVCVLIPALAAVFVLVGCGGTGSGDKGNSQDGKEKTYDIKGKVVSIDREKKVITLDHEDIPGHMKAMEMPFALADVNVFEGIKPGDMVKGKLKVEAGKSTITELQKQ
jgi:Cu/Ag efflux protein CusF